MVIIPGTGYSLGLSGIDGKADVVTMEVPSAEVKFHCSAWMNAQWIHRFVQLQIERNRRKKHPLACRN
ncbi:MAG: hypothetical protein KAH54_08535 [Candidatus Sabulitectum sp.]|nr:hypothetical protein [Candidatus Sabulitectum sp.]